MSLDWTDTEAPEGLVLMTKIDDKHGERNVGALKRQGNLWWTPNGGMYVYYRPTHWRRLTEAEALAEGRKIIAKADAEKHASDAAMASLRSSVQP